MRGRALDEEADDVLDGLARAAGGTAVVASVVVDQDRRRGLESPLVVADLLAKAVLLVLLALVATDPSWGNLAGKAPTARAVTYPLMAFVLPLWWALRRPDAGFPWLPDLLLTFVAFSDVLGNRLDLYDRVVWFDDWMHFANTACVAAALVLVTMHRTVSARAVLERSLALGMTAALFWEVFEYFAFLTSSPPHPSSRPPTQTPSATSRWVGSVPSRLPRSCTSCGVRTCHTLGDLGRDLTPTTSDLPARRP